MFKLISVLLLLSINANSSIINLHVQHKILHAKETLEQISTNSNLSPKLTKELNNLRAEAVELSEIVYSRKCNSYQIHTIPDESCNHVIEKVKHFNDSYTKWTNSFFISRVTLIQQSNEFKHKVNSCVEMMSAFLNTNMTPEVLFPYDLDVNIESRYDTEVTISLTPMYNKKWTFHGNTYGYNRHGEVKYLKKYFMPWTNMCRDIATDRNGRIDDRFMAEVNKYWKESAYKFTYNNSGVYTGIYVQFKEDRKYTLEILVDDKVYKEVEMKYALYNNRETSSQNFMYIDDLPKEEIRFQLGSPARHRIIHWELFLDGKTSSKTIEKTYSVPQGNIEVRFKKKG